MLGTRQVLGRIGWCGGAIGQCDGDVLLRHCFVLNGRLGFGHDYRVVVAGVVVTRFRKENRRDNKRLKRMLITYRVPGANEVVYTDLKRRRVCRFIFFLLSRHGNTEVDSSKVNSDKQEYDTWGEKAVGNGDRSKGVERGFRPAYEGNSLGASGTGPSPSGPNPAEEQKVLLLPTLWDSRLRLGLTCKITRGAYGAREALVSSKSRYHPGGAS